MDTPASEVSTECLGTPERSDMHFKPSQVWNCHRLDRFYKLAAHKLTRLNKGSVGEQKVTIAEQSAADAADWTQINRHAPINNASIGQVASVCGWS